MTLCRFSAPVLVRLPLATGESGLKTLDGPREALHAIHKDGLGGFRFESVELTRTVSKLAKAVLDPTHELLEEAREAVSALAAVDHAPPSYLRHGPGRRRSEEERLTSR